MAALDILLTFLDFAFSILIIFFTIIIFHPINKFKRFKVKEEQLFLQKTLITTIYFCLFILLNIISFFNQELKNYLYIANNFLFNAFVILIILYNLIMTIELYHTYINPVHYFNSLFRQKKFNYIPELIIIIFFLITIGIDFALSYNDYKKEIEENQDGISLSYLFLTIWKPFIIIIVSII